MYAIVKTGGKQYRVQEGESLLVERLPVEDGGSVSLQPLLYVDGSNVVDGDDLAKVDVQARVVGHERGPKLRVVKFKPKRGYKRRTGHRQELTRIEVTQIKLAARRSRSSAAKPADAPPEPEPAPAALEPEPALAALEPEPAPAVLEPATPEPEPAPATPDAAQDTIQTPEAGNGP
jgi:large subunit ribosomal protein L21